MLLEPNPFQDFYRGEILFEDQIGIVFASPFLLNLLKEATIMFADATFKVVPTNFSGGQLFNILTEVRGIVLPIVHILMSGKKLGLYKAALEKVKELENDFSPIISMVDYEAAILNALKSSFPNIRITGCRFHFGQSILKKIKAVGLQTEYVHDNVIRKWGKKYIALCMLPSYLVQGELTKLKIITAQFPRADIKEKMKRFESYFDHFWMGCKTPNHFSVFGLKHRTNNVSESLHSKMSRNMTSHTGFWRFLDQLVHQIILPTEVEVRQMENGENPRPAPRRDRQKTAEKLNLYECRLNSGEWTPTKFLDSCAHLFSDLKMPLDENVQELVETELIGLNAFQTISNIDPTEPSDESKCKVCYVNRLEVLILPCRHFSLCHRCKEILSLNNDKRCPICRADIAEFVSVFY
ncbi:uncharacterized protein LOC136096235 [Hydra vulgaris]|uniref:uncharacterized protein LOC136096235 n=1 Tax=Hydra vulgaris TaxID=6087 RepID=UPI0032EA1C2B